MGSNNEISISVSESWDQSASVGASASVAPTHYESRVESAQAARRSDDHDSARTRGREHSLIRQTLGEAVTALASAVEKRDQYTASHQNRVARLACAISQEMSLSEDRMEGVRMAAVIHDIGKLAIPSDILGKIGKLNDQEWVLIKSHPSVGHSILKAIRFLWPVSKIVHQHHERLDGSGYPSGLRSESILLEARILSVADVVEAMSSHRPYRSALGIEAALDEIRENSGKLYDREVVDSCLRLFSRRSFSLLASCPT